ncbi:UNVERIFIED_CONTAM: Vacuolar cation/proton exchanger 3 [Sesamum radiatum]|uniref:Vacuolar cation/proton exchanger 3 n=1 Tax=Sesamum radiatum TaxID=300843 RepID=A0AAW2NLX3_SESRA
MRHASTGRTAHNMSSSSLRKKSDRSLVSKVRVGFLRAFLGNLQEVLLGTKLALLFLAIPLAIIAKYRNYASAWVFALSLLGLTPLAERVSFLTEQIAFYTGPTVGGLLNATCGNATELIISILALAQHKVDVVKYSLLGSILSNLLLVLGTSLFCGGIANISKEQNFDRKQADVNSMLLLLGLLCHVLPLMFKFAGKSPELTAVGTLQLSRASCIVMLIAYIVYLVFQLWTHRQFFEADEGDEDDDVASDDESPVIGFWSGFIWLVLMTGVVALLSEYVVATIEDASDSWGLSVSFISVILLPIVGNAAEHAGAIIFAFKNKLVPLSVIVAWIMGINMDLDLNLLETSALALSILVTAFTLQDGTSHYIKGLVLLLCYVIIGACFFVFRAPLILHFPRTFHYETTLRALSQGREIGRLKSSRTSVHGMSNNTRATLVCREIPGLGSDNFTEPDRRRSKYWCSGVSSRRRSSFACISLAEKKREEDLSPTTAQLLKHPLAMVALVPKDGALFAAGAIAGAFAKTVIAPLDRVKLLMQTHGLRAGKDSAKKGIGFIEIGIFLLSTSAHFVPLPPYKAGKQLLSCSSISALTLIGKEEGIKGYWKGNLPQVIRVIPYSAVQLFAYEAYKKLFRGNDGELSVIGRLAAGACAGMTSTLVTYPLDVLRLRLAVEPGYKTITEVALNMLREEGFASFYNGLGPSLIGIAPYIAVNFCVFDLVKKALPEKYQKRTETSIATALVSATVATVMCYPLDTVRRQMQMKGSPYMTVLDAFPGIMARDGLVGLYRGFVPNALKTLPNSSIRLTTFDAVKRLIAAAEKEYQKITEHNCKK